MCVPPEHKFYITFTIKLNVYTSSGSLVNWWSPVDKDPTRVKGRTLDLTAGRIETTENIYKYHAQATPSSTPTPQLTPQLTPPIGKPHEETPPPTGTVLEPLANVPVQQSA